MTFHDEVAQVSLRHFHQLPKTGKPSKDEWTVLSCIVREDVDNELEVVALGTGSKCIGRSKMSAKGDILNDSHAEVISRRSFLRYLLYEVETCLSGKSSAFVLNSKKLVLKDGVRFHFFTTHVPCGDAAIFPKSKDCDDVGNCVLTSNDGAEKRKRAKVDADIFRTGARSLPGDETKDLHLDGAGYHTTGLIRTKPGRGDPTLSVSCSDKLAKWCCLGVQGALLSLLLAEPIYLSSLTLAGNTPYSDDALNRALHKRFRGFQLNSPFRRLKIVLGQAEVSFEYCKREGRRACPCSIIWNKDSASSTEVAVEGKKQGTTKSKFNAPASRVKVCKVELFKRFVETYKMLSPECDLSDRTYGEVKRMACDYQNSWNTLKCSHFKLWTLKDPTLSEFKCNA